MFAQSESNFCTLCYHTYQSKMSFGFGLGDFLAVGSLVATEYRKWKDAPKEYDSINNSDSAQPIGAIGTPL